MVDKGKSMGCVARDCMGTGDGQCPGVLLVMKVWRRGKSCDLLEGFEILNISGNLTC